MIHSFQSISTQLPKIMDCCLCSPLVSIFRPPRNTICGRCYEGARFILALTEKLEIPPQQKAEKAKEPAQKGLSEAFNQLKQLKQLDDALVEKYSFVEALGIAFHQRIHTDVELVPKDGPSIHAHRVVMGLSEAFNQLKQLKQLDDALVEKYSFVEALGIAFHQRIHTDVELVPKDGPSIHAHRVVMATKSSVFRSMFEADKCKGPHTGSVPFPDMDHDQLRCLMEFLYSGSLSEEKIEQHGHALFIAADKYDIPFLSHICEAHISNSVNLSNALEVLELATICSATALKETAINAILRHQDEIIFSDKYEQFALKNALLSVEITKALLKNIKGKAATQTQII